MKFLRPNAFADYGDKMPAMVNRISHRGVTKLDETVLLFPRLVEALVELLLPGEAKFGFAGVCFWPLAAPRAKAFHPS